MMVNNQIKIMPLGCESLQRALRVQPREWWTARKQTGEDGDGNRKAGFGGLGKSNFGGALT